MIRNDIHRSERFESETTISKLVSEIEKTMVEMKRHKEIILKKFEVFKSNTPRFRYLNLEKLKKSNEIKEDPILLKLHRTKQEGLQKNVLSISLKGGFAENELNISKLIIIVRAFNGRDLAVRTPRIRGNGSEHVDPSSLR